MIGLVFLILALLCFIVDAFAGILGISSSKISLQSLGLAFYIGSIMLNLS